MNVEDLNIEKEIIPFFDVSLNRYSHAILQSLFEKLPKRKAEANERQEIIKGLISNIGSIKNLYSYKTDIHECVAFCKNIQQDFPILSSAPVQLKIKLLFSKQLAGKLYSKSIQIINLFERINENYLQRLDIEIFPESFRLQIRQMTDTINLLIADKGVKASDYSKFELAEFLLRLYSERDKSVSDFWGNFFTFDAFLSIAMISHKHNFVFPLFIDKGLYLRDFYHFLLKNPVKNTISSDRNVFLLTGPNMSGKSTLLKSISLCVYLARIGLPVPANDCQLVFPDEIDVFINSKDNLESGYSHFMLEIKNLKQAVITAKSNRRVFAVFDEIFKGANVDDALNILYITLRGLQQFENSYFLISTHFHQLKELGVEQFRNLEFYFIDSRIEKDLPEFTYLVKQGWSDAKFGAILFEKEGLLDLLK